MADNKVMNNNLQTGAAAAAASLPPVSKNKEEVSPTPPRVAGPVLLIMVWVWALISAAIFAAADIVTLIVNRTPCTKPTWLFRCVALTEAAAAELSSLLYVQLLCCAAVALAAPLHMLLATRTTSAVVDALAWVALAATAGMHYTEVASDRIFLAADPGDTYTFVDAVFASVCLAVNLLVAAFFLLCSCCCCSPRRLELGEHQHQRDDDDGEV